MNKITKIFISAMATGLLATLLVFCTKKDLPKNEEKHGQEAYGVIWYDEHTSQSLIKDSIYQLIVTIDGVVMATTDTRVFWPSIPVCGTDGAMTIHKYLEKPEPKITTYEIKTPSGRIVAKDKFVFLPDTCPSLRLVVN